MTVEEKAKQYYRVQMSMWPQAMNWWELPEETKTYYIDRMQTIEDSNARYRDRNLQQG